MLCLRGICIVVVVVNVYANEWTYHNMDLWSVDFPDCANDDESPINVETDDAIIDDDVCRAAFDWNIDFTHTSFAVTNNGHSLLLVAAVEDANGTHSLRNTNNSIASFPDYFAPKESIHTKFCLDSFHIHFGASSDFGSEHRIDNVSYPLEMHFVHFACDEGSISTAVQSYQVDPDPHVLAVVAVFFELSTGDNSAFETILTTDLLEYIEEPNPELVMIDGLDLSAMIPSTVATAGYYAYEGSLTTPPCTDIVRWHLMKATGSISESQLQRLRTLKDESGDSMAPNYRAIQFNVNDVWDCKDQKANMGSRAALMSLWPLVLLSLVLLTL